MVTSRGVSRNVAKLLSVSDDDLDKTLCFRIVAAGGDVVDKGHTEKEAVFAKDSFAKVLPIVLVFMLCHFLSTPSDSFTD